MTKLRLASRIAALIFALFSTSVAMAGNLPDGKGTIGIICRANSGQINLVHIFDLKSLDGYELIQLQALAALHTRYVNDQDHLAAGSECTYDHITVDEIGPSVPVIVDRRLY